MTTVLNTVVVQRADVSIVAARGFRLVDHPVRHTQAVQNVSAVYVLPTFALAFQLIGVYLVVQELRRASHLTSTLSHQLNEIAKVWNTADEDARQQVHGELVDDGIFAPIAVEAVATNRRVQLVNLSVQRIADYSTSVNRTSKIVAVAGPTCLALGIVLSFVAGIVATF
ncbi:hypothetical protein [Rhodococcus sp. P1Y]|uniref:hypothetical protein n=1 Tax=Rhodococcus sp. P1Y TaxID=1302308 RepID=UPI001293433F|nr:hypothetical protein [Rhodococcus sp. P1Y]